MLACLFSSRLWMAGSRLGFRLLLALTHITCLSAVDILQRTSGRQEFCQTEVFKAQCSEGEVIAMTHAKYGRMRVGRCVTTDYGHVGCEEDVLVETDRRCSGRRECEVRIPDAVFDAFKPCPIEFKTYFEAEYTCIGVAMADPRLCQTSEVVGLTAPMGYLSNSVAATSGVGATSCPWRITLSPGQRINITLIDFARPLLRPTPQQQQQQEQQHGSLCFQYALITERKATTRTTRVCGGDIRVRHVYISRANIVEIRIIRRNNRDAEEYFLLKYEAVGCSLLENQEHGWIQYDEFGAIIGCNHSEDTWRLSCRDNAWYGMRGNCTTSPPAEKLGMVVWGQLSLPYGVSIGIIVGLAIIVGVIILLVGLICLEWKKMKPEEGEEAVAAVDGSGVPVMPQDGAVVVRPVPRESIYVKQSEMLGAAHHHEVRLARAAAAAANAGGAQGSMSGAAAAAAALRDNDYAYVREMWPMAPPPHSMLNPDQPSLGLDQFSLMSTQEAGSLPKKTPCFLQQQQVSVPPYVSTSTTNTGTITAVLSPTVPQTINANCNANCNANNNANGNNANEPPHSLPGDPIHIYESPKSLRRASRDPHYFQLDAAASMGSGDAVRSADGACAMKAGRAARVAVSATRPHAVYVCDTPKIVSPIDDDKRKNDGDDHRIF